MTSIYLLYSQSYKSNTADITYSTDAMCLIFLVDNLGLIFSLSKYLVANQRL